jgi:hypothetical protein
MIKIEITDPQRENPDVLVKLAAFLMECAGHGIAQVSEEQFNKRMQDSKMVKVPDYTGVSELNPPKEVPAKTVPYQHCGSAQAYGDLDIVPVSAMDMPTNFNEVSTTALKEAFSNVVNAGVRVLEEPAYIYEKATKELIDQVFSKPVIALRCIDDEPLQVRDDKGMLQANDLEVPAHNHIVAESPESAIKADELTDILKRAATPKKRKHKSATEIIKKLETENLYHVDVQPVKINLPPDPVFAPPPPVNGNTVIDKIVMAKATNKLTHEQVTSIVRKHGLVAIKDIFTNDHLIPLIDADLDEALRDK